MKIVVDRSKCAGLGMCEAVAPDIFEVEDSGDMVVHDDAATDDRRADLEDAVQGCPMLALSLES